MTPWPVTDSPAPPVPRGPHFVQPVAPVRALHDDAPSCSPSSPPSSSPELLPPLLVSSSALASSSKCVAASPPPARQGRQGGHAGDCVPDAAAASSRRRRRSSNASVDLILVHAEDAAEDAAENAAEDAVMGAGQGEGASSRGLPSRLQQPALSSPALLPAQRLQRLHRRHHSDPHADPATATPLSRAADDVMLQQQRERERRLRQMDCGKPQVAQVVIPDNKVRLDTSRSAPQRGGDRAVAVRACSPTKSRPQQRWSLGGPLTGASWDIVLGQHGHHHHASLNGVPTTLSSATQDAQQQHDGVCRDPRSSSDEPVFTTEHFVRFVYPGRPCSGCLGRDASVQVSGPPPLQLYVLPKHRYGCRRRPRAAVDGAGGGLEAGEARGGGAGAIRGPCVWLLQAALCLAGLAAIILALALAGAAAFHATEGPHEDLQVRELNKSQSDLVIDLALELRQVSPPSDDKWKAVIERSVEQNEQMVLRAAAAGYGEGGAGEGGARIWTFPGGLLFAASLLTTLGFGAPVPRTPLGRLAAVVLALVGIPLNLVLALQLGRLLCTRLPRLLPLLVPPSGPGPKGRAGRCWPAAVCSRCKSLGEGGGQRTTACMRWAPMLLPVAALLVYYVLGMLLFGAVLGLPAAEWMLFPLSLTAAGGVARVPGWVRVAYAAYLEGGVLLAAVAVALLQAPATTATTDLAMRLGILDLDAYYAA